MNISEFSVQIASIETPPKVRSQKECLLAIFEKMKQTTMFGTIQNPTIWQKNLRDEWE